MPATVMIFGAIYRSMDGLQKFETSVRQAARRLIFLTRPLKGRHYTGMAERPVLALIFGSGWAGKSSLSCSSSNASSGSGWV